MIKDGEQAVQVMNVNMGCRFKKQKPDADLYWRSLVSLKCSYYKFYPY